MNPTPQTERQRLNLKMDSFRFIAEADLEPFQQDPIFREQFNLRIQLAQGYLNEMELWVKLADPARYEVALENARRAIQRVDVLIYQVLDP